MINQGEKTFYGDVSVSGKTYMCGGLVVKYYNLKKKINALITPAPSETIPQFEEDLFLKFCDFDDLNIINLKKSKYIKKLIKIKVIL